MQHHCRIVWQLDNNAAKSIKKVYLSIMQEKILVKVLQNILQLDEEDLHEVTTSVAAARDWLILA